MDRIFNDGKHFHSCIILVITLQLLTSTLSFFVPIANALNTLLNSKDTLTREKVGSGTQTFTTTSDHALSFAMPSGVAWGQGEEIVIDFTTISNGQNGSANGNMFYISATSTWSTADLSVSGDSLTTIDSINSTTATTPNHSSLVYSSSSCSTAGVARVAIAVVSKLNGSEPIFGFKRCGSGTAGAAGITLTISGEAASNGQIGNPSTSGTYAITLLHKNGAVYNNSSTGSTLNSQSSLAISILSNDQIATTATVSPSMTFKVQSVTSLASCNSSITDTGGSFAFPNPMLRQLNNTSQNWICMYINNNSGMVTKGRVYIASTNGALTTQSGYPPAIVCTATTCIPDTAQITTVSSTLSVGTEGYGYCVDSSGGSSNVAITAPFNSSPCTTSSTNSTIATAATTQAEVFSTTSQTAYASILAKVTLSDATPVGTYTDAVSFVGVGVF